MTILGGPNNHAASHLPGGYDPLPVPGSGIYGDGSDGAIAFDGTTTHTGFATTTGSAPNLIYTLTRDIFAAAINVSSGITVISSSFRIFCQTSPVINGTIQNNGTSGSGATAGSPTNGSGSLGGSAIGGTGGATSTNGGAGGTHTNDVGGAAGAGGNAAATNTGGAAGTLTPPTAIQSTPRFVPLAVTGCNAAGVAFQGAPGGGGGAGGTTGTSGGGGGGGGIVVIIAPGFLGTGTIRALGGNGANASGGTSGGGGGGGGGTIIIVTQANQISGGTVGALTLSVAGGNAGTNGGGTGSPGVAGSTGNIYLVPN